MKSNFLQIPAPGLEYIEEEEQTIVNETEVNETFKPANNAFAELNKIGDEILEVVSDFLGQIFAYFL